MSQRRTQVAVVGAGINGLCTAWQLVRAPNRPDVVLLDRFPAGHGRGSSHGDERILRSGYAGAEWVARMQRTQLELWPALEADLGRRLVHSTPAVFWGPESGPIAAYANAVRASCVRVEEIDVATARRRFPHMTFAGAQRVLHDHTAGVIAAGATVSGLEAWLAERGVDRIVATVTHLERDGEGVCLHLAGGETIRADSLVLAAGPWVEALVPSLASTLVVARQDVGFWEMDVEVGRTPAWVHLGEAGLDYGLPTLAGGAMKAAFHRKASSAVPERDDPNVVRGADEDALDAMQARLKEWFAPGPGPRLRSDTCFYTNTADDEFVIAPAPNLPGVLVVSACSGHAFKLGPLTGEAAAQWAAGRMR